MTSSFRHRTLRPGDGDAFSVKSRERVKKRIPSTLAGYGGIDYIENIALTPGDHGSRIFYRLFEPIEIECRLILFQMVLMNGMDQILTGGEPGVGGIVAQFNGLVVV